VRVGTRCESLEGRWKIDWLKRARSRRRRPPDPGDEPSGGALWSMGPLTVVKDRAVGRLSFHRRVARRDMVVGGRQALMTPQKAG
jgi:hypothetical protein